MHCCLPQISTNKLGIGCFGRRRICFKSSSEANWFSIFLTQVFLLMSSTRYALGCKTLPRFFFKRKEVGGNHTEHQGEKDRRCQKNHNFGTLVQFN